MMGLWSALKGHHPARHAEHFGADRPAPRGRAQVTGGRNCLPAPCRKPSPLRPAGPAAPALIGLRDFARNAFPFLVVGAIWEIVARSASFCASCFRPWRMWRAPSMSSASPASCRTTPLRRCCACSPASAWRRCRAHHRRADGALPPGRGHLPAAGLHPRADSRPRLHAAVPALVRTGGILRRAAGRFRVDVSGDLQLLDRREGGKEIWLRSAQAMGADDARIFRHVIIPGALPYILTGLGSAWRRPGASWWRWKCSPPCPGGSAG